MLVSDALIFLFFLGVKIILRWDLFQNYKIMVTPFLGDLGEVDVNTLKFNKSEVSAHPDILYNDKAMAVLSTYMHRDDSRVSGLLENHIFGWLEAWWLGLKIYFVRITQYCGFQNYVRVFV